jgi:hypothetical protein
MALVSSSHWAGSSPSLVYYKIQRVVFDEALGAGSGNFTVMIGPVTPGALGL